MVKLPWFRLKYSTMQHVYIWSKITVFRSRIVAGLCVHMWQPDGSMTRDECPQTSFFHVEQHHGVALAPRLLAKVGRREVVQLFETSAQQTNDLILPKRFEMHLTTNEQRTEPITISRNWALGWGATLSLEITSCTFLYWIHFLSLARIRSKIETFVDKKVMKRKHKHDKVELESHAVPTIRTSPLHLTHYLIASNNF